MEPAELSDLCKLCRVLQFDNKRHGGHFNRDKNGRPELAHQAGETKLAYTRVDALPGLSVLKQSADLGCRFCALLRCALLRRHAGGKAHELKITELRLIWKHGEILGPQIGIVSLAMVTVHLEIKRDLNNTIGDGTSDNISKDSYSWDPWDTIYFEVYARPGPSARMLNILSRPSLHPKSDEGISTIKSWFTEDTYWKPKDIIHIPARLLDVVGRPGQNEPQLVETSSAFFDKGPYAALSYCWGVGRQLTTQSWNLKERLHEIKLEDFPKTCRDAVLVTRSLGIRYLWIDALCIVQDSPADWESESKKMSDIYRGAYVTFIPLHSASSRDGFLERPLAQNARVPWQSSDTEDAGGEYYLRDLPVETYRDLTSYTLAQRHFAVFSCELARSPWNRRGWTFQENLVSTRQLFFGEHMLYFDCITEKRTDCGALSFPGFFPNTFRAGATHSMNWNAMIAPYTDRDLTYATDRLPAISSLASYTAKLFGGEYLAGLWRGTLITDLLWLSYGDQKPQSLEKLLSNWADPNKYVAPSWTWAYGARSVMWTSESQPSDEQPEFGLECEIIDAGVEFVDDNPTNSFWKLKGGHISIRGKLYEIPDGRLHLSPGARMRPGMDRWLHNDHWPMEQRFLQAIGGGHQTWSLKSGEEPFGVCYLDWEIKGYDFSTSFPLAENSLDCLRLVLLSSGYDSDFGLVLLPTANAEEFRRVGMVKGDLRSRLARDFPETEESVFTVV